MQDKTALIDGDVIVYWVANNAQTNTYDVINDKGDVLAVCNNKTEAKESKEDLEQFGDSTFEILPGEIRLKAWREVEVFTDSFLKKILKDSGCKDMKVHLSGHTNFRKEIATVKPYKGNRKSERPFYYQKIRDYLEDKYDALMSVNEEADDTLAIAQYIDPDNTVICSVDKDLWMVPGEKFNFKKGEKSIVSKYEGMRKMQYQMLVGDSVDNIQGVSKIGPKKAEKLLAENTDIDKAWRSISEAYKKAYGKDHRKIMTEMGQLLWMRSYEGETQRIINKR